MPLERLANQGFPAQFALKPALPSVQKCPTPITCLK